MTRTRDYIRDKKIEVLFEELMRNVIDKKPDDPVNFLVALLQERGQGIFVPSQPTITNDGPSRAKSSIKCSGQAINVRQSLERILPGSCETMKPKKDSEVHKFQPRPKTAPIRRKPASLKEPVAVISSAEIPVVQTMPTEVASSSMIEEQPAEYTETVATAVTEAIPISATLVESVDEVVVTQEYVTAVESIFSFRKKNKTRKISESSDDTIKSEKKTESDKESVVSSDKEKKKKKEKRSKLENEKGEESAKSEISEGDCTEMEKKEEKILSEKYDNERSSRKEVEGTSEENVFSEMTNKEKSIVHESKENTRQNTEDSTEENTAHEIQSAEETSGAVMSQEEELIEETEEEILEEPERRYSEEDVRSVLMTGSCNLTELASWHDTPLEAESLASARATLKESLLNTVHSAAPTPISMLFHFQAEDAVLREEVMPFHPRTHTRSAVSAVIAPCRTVFFEEPEEAIPTVTEPEQIREVHAVRNQLTRLKKVDSNDSLSISELSGCPWSFAESVA